jgi:hypothetical protein
MDKITPEIDAKIIVLRGNFNPVIFQPSWFAQNGLVHKEEAEEASISTINPFIAQFSLAGFDLQVTATRFTVSAPSGSHFEPLRDIVMGTFMLLRHTPIHLLGINRQTHFKLENSDQLEKIFNRIAPLSEWNDILKQSSFESLTISGIREDDKKGSVRVKVEQSTRIKPGIFFDLNDHYDLESESEKVINAEKAVSVLKGSWDDSQKRSEKIIYSIFSKRL